MRKVAASIAPQARFEAAPQACFEAAPQARLGAAPQARVPSTPKVPIADVSQVDVRGGTPEPTTEQEVPDRPWSALAAPPTDRAAQPAGRADLPGPALRRSESGTPASIPCAIVTGALGSGKTTLIRDLMQRPGMEGTALIINEFGEVGLDHLLVASAVETTLLMENGCLCCSLRGDLVDTVLSLIASVARGEVPPFARIVIETTGLADPLPIVRDLTSAPVLRGKVHLAGVTTCVDGLLGLARDPVAIAQVAQADLCLLTKADLADPLALDQLREAVARVNPLAVMQVLVQGRLDRPDVLFEAGAMTGGAAEDGQPGGTGCRHGRAHEHGHEHADGQEHDTGHDCTDHAHPTAHREVAAGTDLDPHDGVESWSVQIDRPLPWARFRDWFDLLYSLNGGRMLRMKGLLWIEERDRPLLVQAVGPVIAPATLQADWHRGAPQTRLVLIARGLSAAALAASFREYVLPDA